LSKYNRELFVGDTIEVSICWNDRPGLRVGTANNDSALLSGVEWSASRVTSSIASD